LPLYPVLIVGETFNEQVEHVDSFTATIPSRAARITLRRCELAGPMLARPAA
jgi:hypothetical protein